MIYKESVTSTNDELKKLINEGKADDYYSLYTFFQTNGKGRNNREFESKNGGLYYSLAAKISDWADLNQLPVFISLSVCKVIEEFFNIKCSIKWVNDIIYNHKKCSGILCEKIYNFAILGIGINIYNPVSLSISNKAISLKENGQIDYRLLHKLALKLDSRLKSELANFLKHKRGFNVREYAKKSAILGKECTLSVPDGEIIAQGAVCGFTKNGGVIINSNDKREIYNSGEITLTCKELYTK